MITLTERMNIKFGARSNAYVLRNVNLLGQDAYETLCFICSELSVDLTHIDPVDFELCVDVIINFCNCANDQTGYVVSVWFDDVNQAPYQQIVITSSHARQRNTDHHHQ